MYDGSDTSFVQDFSRNISSIYCFINIIYGKYGFPYVFVSFRIENLCFLLSGDAEAVVFDADGEHLVRGVVLGYYCNDAFVTAEFDSINN